MSQGNEEAVCIENSRKKEVVGLPGIEPGTSRLSGVRSNRLSYKPTKSVLERKNTRKKHNASQKTLLIIHLERGFVKLILGLTHFFLKSP